MGYSKPKIQFGADGHLPEPEHSAPFGLVFDASVRTGNQVAPNDVQSVSLNPPCAMALTRITGNSSQAAGFAMQIYVTRNGEQRQLASCTGHGANAVGTAQRPMDMDSAEILDPSDLVTVEVSNYAASGADIQVVLWGVAAFAEQA